MNNNKRKIPIEAGLWEEPSAPDKKAKLMGSKCRACGELYFPRMKKGLCVHCQAKDMEDVLLDGKGSIASFSIVERAPAGGFYKGPVPYAYGDVNLDDGVVLRSLFAGDFEDLKVGMEAEMVIEKLYEDEEGNEIMTYMFKPIQREKDNIDR